MRYQQPYGTPADSSYINGNPAAGIQGSIPPAAAFEQPMREIVACIQNSDYLPTDDDLQQLLKSMRRQWLNFAIDTGAVNALVVALTPPLDVYHAGFPLRVLVNVTNTGPSTINVNGLGIRNILRGDGSALHAGDLSAGMIANLVDTGSAMQLQNPLLGVASTSNTYNVDIPYCADTSTVANQILANYLPAITSITEGKYIAVKVAITNTGPVQIYVNALAPLPVCRDDGQALHAGDILAQEALLLENHGSYYQVACGLVRSQVILPPAPHLVGMMSWGGPGVISGFPSATNVQIPFQTPFYTTLNTSTFDGYKLTIGAGEDGIWLFSVNVAFYFSGVVTNIVTCGIENSRTATFAIGQDSTLADSRGGGGGIDAHATGACPCIVGDKIGVVGYHQTSGSGVMQSDPNHTYLHGFMISK